MFKPADEYTTHVQSGQYVFSYGSRRLSRNKTRTACRSGMSIPAGRLAITRVLHCYTQLPKGTGSPQTTVVSIVSFITLSYRYFDDVEGKSMRKRERNCFLFRNHIYLQNEERRNMQSALLSHLLHSLV